MLNRINPSAQPFDVEGSPNSDIIEPPQKLPKEHKGLRLLLDVRRDPLGYFTKMMRDGGPYTWLNLNGMPLLMLNDATGIKHVLRDNPSNYDKARFNKVLRPLLGQGIFLSNGEVWRDQRRESAPVFAGGNFEEMTRQMVEATQDMLDRWDVQVKQGNPIDIRLESMKFTLDVLLRSLFHVNEVDIAAGVQSALGVLLSEAEGRIWSPFNLPQSMILQLPKYKRSMQFLQNIVHELVEARRAKREYPNDLLSRLIDSYGYAKENQHKLRDQVMSFLLAGHETTAHAMSWSYFFLATHPDAQERLIEERDRVIGNRTPTLKDVGNLTYSGWVFKEAMRLCSPVWTMSREAIQNDLIPLDNGQKVVLPRGSAIMLCMNAVHRRELYWKDPEAFWPERFSPEESTGRPEFAWFPFGGGARLCLGHRFAEVEALVAMSMIGRDYKISLLPGQNIKPEPIITLRPSEPVLVRAIPRHQTIQHSEAVALAQQAGGGATPSACPYKHG